MTLTASMGIQSELQQIRKENDSPFQDQPSTDANTTSATADAATIVGQSLESVENAVCSVAGAMIPSWSAVSAAMPSSICSISPVVVDLTLPTSSGSSASKTKGQ